MIILNIQNQNKIKIILKEIQLSTINILIIINVKIMDLKIYRTVKKDYHLNQIQFKIKKIKFKLFKILKIRN
jgi:hypothetical protein